MRVDFLHLRNSTIMRQLLILISSLFIAFISFAQSKNLAGVYGSTMLSLQVKFNPDSTFEYSTKGLHPTFYRWENFYEKGNWTVCGDTVILNPGLPKKVYVEAAFNEEKNNYRDSLLLTFNHIKRYYDENGTIIKTDTLQIDQLDYSFNELKKKNRTRVSPHRLNTCTFAGYIPKGIITTSRTIAIQKPAEAIHSIFIGCYELQGTKEFVVNDPLANHFTLNVYSNYYKDGQIRQVKFLLKGDNVLYTKQKANGSFEKDNIWSGGSENKLKKQKSGG